MPSSRIGALLGIQYQNAALSAVPPSSAAFSSTITSSPCQRANSAVGSPPPPPPTTTTSASASNAVEDQSTCTGSALRRSGIPVCVICRLLGASVPALLRLRRDRGAVDGRSVLVASAAEDPVHHPRELRDGVLRRTGGAPRDEDVGAHEDAPALLHL